MTIEKMLTGYQFHTSPSWQHTQIDLDTKIHTYCHGRLEGVKEIRKTCSVRKESRLESSQNREAKIKACHRKARKAGGNITVPSTINSITDTVKKKTNPFSAIHSRNINRYTAQVRIHMYVVYCSKARAFWFM